MVDPDRIEREIDLRPGGELVCHWTEHGTVRAVIEVVEPARRFRFRWAGPLSQEPVEGNTTTVEFTLAATVEGTRLRVVETGFTHLQVPPAAQRRYREENAGGWLDELDELRDHLVDVDA